MITPTEPWDPNKSPLLPLLTHVIGSIENIAPERRQDLGAMTARVKFIVDDEPGFVFSASGTTDPREVRSSIVGLELLWCLAYGHTTIYQAAPNIGDPEPVIESPQIKDAAAVLAFAFTDRAPPKAPVYALPSTIPAPAFTSQSGGESITDLHAATEIFLCATAWILHHELGHVVLNHLDTTVKSPQDELDADRAATEWILEMAPSETVLKRGLGIGVAVATLAALALGRPRGHARRSTYPTTGERVLQAMSHSAFGDQHQAHDFAAVAIQTHLQQRSMAQPGLPVANAYDALHDACVHVMDWELGR